MWFISILYLIVMINCYNIDKIDDDDDDGDILYFVPFESWILSGHGPTSTKFLRISGMCISL